jgi:hypothetical protein
MTKSARNERRKLTAGLLNSISAGILLGSLVAPYVGIGLGQMPPNPSIPNLVGLSAFGLVLGLMVHLVARRQLQGMED